MTTTIPPQVQTAVAEAVRSVLALAGDITTAYAYADLLADVAYDAGTFALEHQEAPDQAAALLRVRNHMSDAVRLIATDAEQSTARKCCE
ncbi:hypothetical protein ACWIGW_44430 [Nocardia brasiliensis]|uniref:hypothetical protein n=1 Tax=Streptomyces sp. NPDC056056 TaxID=3345698 RepID=UPI0035D70676